MKISLHPSTRPLQKFVLHQSMALLGLSASELTEHLSEAEEANPQLLVRQPRRRFFVSGGSTDILEQTAASQPDGLYSHVMSELSGLLAAGGKLSQVVASLIEDLDPCGWVLADLSLLAAQLKIDEDLVEAALKLVQRRVSPTGLFARNLGECLRLQLEEQGGITPQMELVLAHLTCLKSGELSSLVAATGLDAENVQECLSKLKTLNPKPGAQFIEEPALLREPDASVTKVAGRWQLKFNRDTEPSIEVAKLSADKGHPQLEECLKKARLAKRALDMRRSATRQVIQALVTWQTGYLEFGETALRPLSMTELGQTTGFHTSTVSRVLNGYLIETPRGIVEAKSLCPGATARTNGTHSKVQVTSRMRAMIDAEDPANPLTDARIARLLAEEGIAISRRVAANYRQECGYPRAALRQKTA